MRRARLLVVQHEPECPPALVGDWLTEAGCELDVRHPYAGDALPTLEGYAGLLVLGGAMGANDDDLLGWIGPTKDLVRDAVAEDVPTLGICLGHQLMAAALGGRVDVNPRGQQVGLIGAGWTDAAADDPLVAALATPRRGVHWNHDIVLDLPPDAVLLAETEQGEPQVVRYARRAWGVQHHPEVDEVVVGTWVTETERTELAGRGLDADALLADIRAARAELDRAWRPLAAGFADVAQGSAQGTAQGTAQGSAQGPR